VTPRNEPKPNPEETKRDPRHRSATARDRSLAPVLKPTTPALYVRPALLGILGSLAVATAAISQEARTSAHGVYSEEQAERGGDLIYNICSECHVDDDFGGPFMQSWNGASVKTLMDEIRSTMPEDNPGGLPVQQYIDVIAYMFKLNGMPTGDREMGPEEIDSIQIDWRPSYDDVEAPVPDTAAVRTKRRW